MGFTSQKQTAAIKQRKQQRRSGPSSGSRSSSPIQNASQKGKLKTKFRSRARAIFTSRFAKRVKAKALGITRRITRSMSKKQKEIERSLSELCLFEEMTSLSSTPPPSPSPSPPPINLKDLPLDHPSDCVAIFPAVMDPIVPRFDLGGKHNCWNHPRKSKIKTGQSVSEKPSCRDCKEKVPAGRLDTLPCGHSLCWGCLTLQAVQAATFLFDEERWEAVLHEMHGDLFDQPFDDYVGGDGPAVAILKEAGMLCCGVDMRLDRFLGCLPEHIGTIYWLAHNAVRSHPDSLGTACGWPDCGHQLVPVCRFQRELCQYCYCPCCGGTSMLKKEDGTAIPARSWYAEDHLDL